MRNNKNALARYKAIDSLLADGNGHTIKEMQDACLQAITLASGETSPVSRVTIYDDLKSLQQTWDVTIESTGTRPNRYYYSKDSKTMAGVVIAQDEDSILLDAIRRLETISGFVRVGGTISRLKKTLSHSDDAEAEAVIDFEKSQELGSNRLVELHKKILEKKPITITYNRQYKLKATYDLSPHYLKQYNGRWYLLAWKHSSSDDNTPGRRCFALDRIEGNIRENKTLAKQGLYHERDIDYESYFSDIVGVFRAEKITPIEIVLQIKNTDGSGYSDMKNIETMKIHASQILVHDEMTHTARVTLRLCPNQEFYNSLLPYSNIEVLSPIEVRNKFIQKLKSLCANYSELDTKE